MLERVLRGVSIASSMICGLFFMDKARKLEKKKDSLILLGIGLFFFMQSLSIIFWTLAQSLDYGEYIGHIFFQIPRHLYDDSFNYHTGFGDVQINSIRLGIISLTIGVILFIYCYEKSQDRKVFLSYLLILVIPLQLFFPLIVCFILNSIILLFGCIIFCYIIYDFTKWSSKELKPLSSFIYLGFMLNFASEFFHMDLVKRLEIFPLELSPLLTIVANIIFMIPFRINHHKLNKNLKLITLLNFISIFAYISSIVLTINVSIRLGIDYQILTSAYFHLIGILTILIFYTLSIRILSNKSKIESPVGDKINLSIFSRPSTLTEEEISISKEKKVCLVCKSKIGGFNLAFFCKGCDAIYCEKCVSTLADIDNSCWVCNTPFDRTKPIPKIEKKEETFIIAEKQKG